MAGFGALLHLYMFLYIACTIAAATVYKCSNDFEIRKAQIMLGFSYSLELFSLNRNVCNRKNIYNRQSDIKHREIKIIDILAHLFYKFKNYTQICFIYVRMNV